MTPRRRLANQRCHAKRKERQRTGPPVPSLIHPGSNNDLTTDQEKRNAVLLYGDPKEPETIAQSITAQILARREAKEDRRKPCEPYRFVTDQKGIVRSA